MATENKAITRQRSLTIERKKNVSPWTSDSETLFSSEVQESSLKGQFAHCFFVINPLRGGDKRPVCGNREAEEWSEQADREQARN